MLQKLGYALAVWTLIPGVDITPRHMLQHCVQHFPLDMATCCYICTKLHKWQGSSHAHGYVTKIVMTT